MDVHTALAAKAAGPVISGDQLDELIRKASDDAPRETRRTDSAPRRQRQVGLG